MVYGAETWAVKKAQGKKLDVAVNEDVKMDEWSPSNCVRCRDLGSEESTMDEWSPRAGQNYE